MLCIWYQVRQVPQAPAKLWFQWEEGTKSAWLLTAAAYQWWLHSACSKYHALLNVTDTEIAERCCCCQKQGGMALVHQTVLGIEHSLCSPLVKLGESRYLIPNFFWRVLTNTTKATKKEKKTLKNNPPSFLIFSRQQYALKVCVPPPFFFLKDNLHKFCFTVKYFHYNSGTALVLFLAEEKAMDHTTFSQQYH